MSEATQPGASFGFQDVHEADKPRLVRGVFDSVASRYDLMNDLMSLGVHRLWKSTLLDRVNPQPGERLLDMAGGTGDVARGFLRRADARARAQTIGPACAVVCDINANMLRTGILRDCADSYGDRMRRLCADAENIPVPDETFDAYTISFGIRNVTHIDKALGEAFRVLKVGGRFFCLEFSHPITEGFQAVYDAYSFNVIPWLGEKVAQDRESYQYLVESIRRFPKQEAFAAMIASAGFSRVSFENLTGGVAALHVGWRL